MAKLTEKKARRFGPLTFNLPAISSLIAILVGMLFGLIILLFTNSAQAWGGFSAFAFGP